MFGGVSYKTKQFFLLLIKLSIVFGASYFIYQKLVNNKELEFSVFFNFLIENDVFSTKNLIFLLFLTVFNWFFEILKWQNLTSIIQKISFFNSQKQSLASLTASIFTPNRIGEYGVKVMYFRKEKRKKILLLNLLGNITQMSTTLFFGLIGVAFFILTYDVSVSFYKIGRFIILLILIASFIFIGSKHKTLNIKGFSLMEMINFYKSIPFSIHLKTILFSIIRYFIFSFQFFYLLSIIGVDISYFKAMVIISSYYLLSSIIPTLFILDVIVKGSVGIFLFEYVMVNNFTVLSIVTLMWLLNFVLPSIIGSFYVMQYKYPKSIENELK